MAGDRMQSILSAVLREITPTEQEQAKTKAMIELVTSETEKVIKPLGLEYTIAGSYMRDTWMRDKKEFDLFVLFPVKTSRSDLENKGIAIGRQIVSNLHGHSRIAYAEHPYVRAKAKNYDIDIVPCYKVESAHKIKSAVDRTPFHNKWLARHLLPELRPEVRLLKQFCKAQGFYGSDTKFQAFSGYLCELLIVHYRSFRNLAEKAAGWEPGRILINLEGMGGEDVEAVHGKFRKQPLIVIDPVDPGRNVAAALSPESFTRFVNACKKLIARPDRRIFERKDFPVSVARIASEHRARKTLLMGVSFKPPDIIPDILWPQLRKTAKRLKDILEDCGFSVLNHFAWSDDSTTAVFVFEMEVWELPKPRKIEGPSMFVINHAQDFLRKYRPLGRVWVEGENWVAEVNRQHTDAFSKLKDTLKGTEHSLHQKGIASHIAKRISKGFTPMKEREILSLARKHPEFSRVLDDVFRKEI